MLFSDKDAELELNKVVERYSDMEFHSNAALVAFVRKLLNKYTLHNIVISSPTSSYLTDSYGVRVFVMLYTISGHYVSSDPILFKVHDCLKDCSHKKKVQNITLRTLVKCN